MYDLEPRLEDSASKCICEPQSIFTAHIPQRPLNRVQAHQVRQGLRPDIVFKVAAPFGLNKRLIANIKTISLGNKSLYKSEGRAVDIRASRI